MPFVTLLYAPTIAAGGSALDAFDSIGGLHSVRYVGLSHFALACECFPVLGQNTGQSTLYLLTLLLGFSQLFIATNLWLSGSMLMLLFSVFSSLRTWQFSRRASGLGSLVFIAGSSGLSSANVHTVDSGFPKLVNGYTDVMLAAGISIVVLRFVTDPLLGRSLKRFLGMLFVGLISGAALSFTAPQIAIGLMAILAFFFVFPKLTPAPAVSRLGLAFGIAAGLASRSLKEPCSHHQLGKSEFLFQA